MARDVLDPGPEGTYPGWPRRPDGTPAGKGLPVTTEAERQAEQRMPTGIHWQKDPSTGRWVKVDLTLRQPDGTPVVDAVPDLPPEG